MRNGSLIVLALITATAALVVAILAATTFDDTDSGRSATTAGAGAPRSAIPIGLPVARERSMPAPPTKTKAPPKLAGVLGASTAATWRYLQLDADRCWDAAHMDADFNGLAEDAWYDVDNDCRLDTRLWNSVGADSLLESLTFDMNEDGHWEYWLLDTDQREGYEVAYFDVNADGYYDGRRYIRNEPDISLGTIGGAPQRSGALGLVEWLAGITGKAVWSR